MCPPARLETCGWRRCRRASSSARSPATWWRSRRLWDMQAVTTCPCSACANISMLKLKFVVHHGKFSRQRLGSVEQLHGTDVIVAHRLLKNSVPSKEYLLVTDAVLDRLPTGTRDRFTPHTESFDLGAISGGYQEIAHLWEEARARE